MERLEEYRGLPTPAAFEVIVNGLMDDVLQICRGATGQEIRRLILRFRVEHPTLHHRIIAHLHDNLPDMPLHPGIMGATMSTRVAEAAGTEVEVQYSLTPGI